MFIKSKSFQAELREVKKNNFLHVIHIEKIDKVLSRLIETYLSTICEGDPGFDFETVKKKLRNIIQSKKDSTLELGIISEFFLHLYLNEIGFKQECLFFNLEEGSIKKGFDGYYSLGTEAWILESKSGSSKTSGISHPKKIKEAYDDLENKLSGKVSNDPWHNAYNHAKMVNSSDDIKKNLKKLSKAFTEQLPQNIGKFNIIPGSTIFVEDSWAISDPNKLCSEMKIQIKKFNFKKIKIICVNKNSLMLFRKFLDIN
jgi:hypothetical protein